MANRIFCGWCARAALWREPTAWDTGPNLASVSLAGVRTDAGGLAARTAGYPRVCRSSTHGFESEMTCPPAVGARGTTGVRWPRAHQHASADGHPGGPTTPAQCR